MTGLVGARVAPAIDDSPVPLCGTVTAVEPYDAEEGPSILLVQWDGDPDGPVREPFDDLRQVRPAAATDPAVAAARLSLLLASDDFVASLVLGGRRFGYRWSEVIADITAARDALDAADAARGGAL